MQVAWLALHPALDGEPAVTCKGKKICSISSQFFLSAAISLHHLFICEVKSVSIRSLKGNDSYVRKSGWYYNSPFPW